MDSKEYITVAQAAKRLKLSKTRVRTLITSGRLPALKVGPLYTIRVTDLEEFEKIPRKPGKPSN